MTVDDFKEVYSMNSCDLQLKLVGVFDEIPNCLNFYDMFVLRDDLGIRYVCVGDDSLVRLVPDPIKLPML